MPPADRKLQKEIEQTLKKVQEGIDLFDETIEKLNGAEKNPALREKYEAELKKEIKKLQKLRDSIKGWISGKEVQDKDGLVERRRDIETVFAHCRYSNL